MMEKEHWRLREGLQNAELSQVYEKEFGFLLGKLLAARGLQNLDDVKSFINPKLSLLPSPFSLKNLEASAELVAQYISENKKILVYGDYDVDGMSGLTLASDFFKKISFDHFICYQPHRFDEGYGVHVSALERIYQDFTFDLVLTVDSGITALEPAEWLQKKNIPFVITDHHLPGPQLPETPYIVNPNQGSCASELGMLCGTAVMFFLCAGIKAKLKKEIKMDEFLDLVALATIADQMELTPVNRALVREGLKRWPQKGRPGLRLLTSSITKDLDARDIAFTVAPKLNAASRMGQVEKALKLLQAPSLEEAHLALTDVEALNSDRVASQAIVLKEAQEQAWKQAQSEQKVLCVYGEGWVEGVLGIVAARLVEEFYLPTIVLSKTHQGTFRGSMRCPVGFHCLSFLEGARSILAKFGGHAEAAGLEINSEKLSHFEAYIRTMDFSSSGALGKTVDFDGYIENLPTIEDVQRLSLGGPWGRSNPQPLFCVSRLRLSDRTVMKERHVKWKFGNFGSVIGFGFEELCQKFSENNHQEIDALVIPELQEWREKISVQLRISKLRISQS
jgi:single-stranded-DNA-specific exonuclease